MSITSDLTIDSSKFRPDNVSEATHQANAAIKALMSQGPAWYDVGAAEYRRLHIEGKIALPPPVYLPNAIDALLPSRDPGRDIPIRVYYPDNGEPSKGVFLHIHGGGFVLGSEKSSDKQLQMLANGTQLTAISVGYRHAPEDPYPAAVHDSVDAAEYLIDRPSAYGAVRFIGGESAGASLAVIAALHLLQSRPSFAFLGVLAIYGLYDWTLGLPTALDSANSLVVNRPALENFGFTYLAGVTAKGRRHPSISPLYTNLRSLAAGAAKGLPPVLFIVGTEDCLLDDTILMSTKWSIAGGENIVKIFPGAPHAFTVVPGLPVADEANTLMIRWLNEKMGENN